MNDNLYIGAVVKSIAGRDRNRVFIVYDVKYTNDYPLLAVADGDLRRMDGGKYKNPCHVKIIGRLTDEEMKILKSGPDDEAIKELVSVYDRYKKS